MAEWPEIAIPVGEREVELATTGLRASQSWTFLFTLAALSENLHVLYRSGWCNQAITRAIVFRPDGTRYGQPPSGADEARNRWAAWRSPPVVGHELGIALAAQFGRDSEHTIRDDWGNKTIPVDPVQVFRAARWMRFSCGWSTFGSLKSLVKVLTPWFVDGWCPAAIVWAVEHRPNKGKYSTPPQNIEQISSRLAVWGPQRKDPPIAGATWEQTVGARRERVRRENSGTSDAVERWRQNKLLHDERWKYRRTVHSKREEDLRIQQVMEGLYPDPRRLVGQDTQAPSVNFDLCPCRRYEKLPGQQRCVACINEKRTGSPYGQKR
ncbi:hypothetical protein LV75_004971 [Actinokineospora diospyrosa]|uniref:Uncharacterized protein n=1 Tax=Actinokineospora diospyrosa TaxID=103728 RepID=A0ABT1IIH2_9PSEU|nr:hypothetical protein [Actinokineospora diospyrosa]